MILSEKVTDALRRRCGNDLRLPSDVEALAIDIEAVTSEHVGVNTLKRLLGFIADEREPRMSTLDIVARYLGYSDWGLLQHLDTGSNSDFGISDGALDIDGLHEGQRVVLTYQPNRHVEMEYLGNRQFHIIQSVNSKLHTGDRVDATHIVRGYPLLLAKVVRDGKDLGAFTAGKAQGIDYTLLQ